MCAVIIPLFTLLTREVVHSCFFLLQRVPFHFIHKNENSLDFFNFSFISFFSSSYIYRMYATRRARAAPLILHIIVMLRRPEEEEKSTFFYSSSFPASLAGFVDDSG